MRSHYSSGRWRIGSKFPKELKKNLPVIKKEVRGNSSKNQMIINSIDQIPKIENKNFFFQKYIKSEEFGMDILNDLFKREYPSIEELKEREENQMIMNAVLPIALHLKLQQGIKN